jgi:hypothetical protein
MDIGEKEVPSLVQSERFMDDSIEDSGAEDGLSDNDNKALSAEEEDIKETK